MRVLRGAQGCLLNDDAELIEREWAIGRSYDARCVDRPGKDDAWQPFRGN